ncbi:MAG: hypothetical protein WCF65_00670 [Parachlamydiaceae bacterium]
MKQHSYFVSIIYLSFFCCSLLILSIQGYAASILPADISLFMIELKYEENEGVKICEIQPLSQSSFEGCDYVYQQKDIVGLRVCQFLSQFGKSFWFVKPHIAHEKMGKLFSAQGWKPFPSLKNLYQSKKFLQLARKPVCDPTNISSYHAILFMRLSEIGDLRNGYSMLSGVLLIDRASVNSMTDKYTQSLLFTGHPVLENIKPKWGLFPKKYSEQLVAEIKNKIDSDMLVIKPLTAIRGRGVIIINNSDLDTTLQSILNKNIGLTENPDRGYSYWANDSSTSFLVEEFIKTTPVPVPTLDNQSYDVTMRLAVALVYHQNSIYLHFLGDYCNLSDTPIDDDGSLNDKHKTSLRMPQTILIQPAARKEIQELLSKPLVMMYKCMLGFDVAHIEEGVESAVITSWVDSP